MPNQISKDASIVIKASAYRGTVHDFSLSVESEEAAGLTREGVPAWKKGQVVRLNKENFGSGFCEGCVLKVLLDVQDEGYYHIMAQTTDATPQLQNLNQIDDIVGYNETQCYKYFVYSSQTDVQVHLTTYSGKVSLQAAPEPLPEKWEDFPIKTDSATETELILDIRPWVRHHMVRKPEGLYFLCVHGELTSTYSLRIKEFNQERHEPINLEDGYSETFYTRGGDTRIFFYEVPKLEYKEEDVIIHAYIMFVLKFKLQ